MRPVLVQKADDIHRAHALIYGSDSRLGWGSLLNQWSRLEVICGLLLSLLRTTSVLYAQRYTLIHIYVTAVIICVEVAVVAC